MEVMGRLPSDAPLEEAIVRLAEYMLFVLEDVAPEHEKLDFFRTAVAASLQMPRMTHPGFEMITAEEIIDRVMSAGGPGFAQAFRANSHPDHIIRAAVTGAMAMAELMVIRFNNNDPEMKVAEAPKWLVPQVQGLSRGGNELVKQFLEGKDDEAETP